MKSLTTRQIASRLSNAAKVFGLRYGTIDGITCPDRETAENVVKHLRDKGNDAFVSDRIDPVSKREYFKAVIRY